MIYKISSKSYQFYLQLFCGIDAYNNWDRKIERHMSQLSTIIEQGSINNMFFSEIFFFEKIKETRGTEVHVLNYRDNELKIHAPIVECLTVWMHGMVHRWMQRQTYAPPF